MKRLFVLLLALAMMLAMAACGEGLVDDQGNGGVVTTTASQNLGKYSVTIDGCRLAKDYSGNDVVIVQYTFTNVSDDDATSFMVAFDDQVYQNGVGLNGAYVLDDSANYDSGNQMKQIKKGASIQVEVAYELNDLTSDIEVEVSELFSLNDNVVKKTFKLG